MVPLQTQVVAAGWLLVERERALKSESLSSRPAQLLPFAWMHFLWASGFPCLQSRKNKTIPTTWGEVSELLQVEARDTQWVLCLSPTWEGGQPDARRSNAKFKNFHFLENKVNVLPPIPPAKCNWTPCVTSKTNKKTVGGGRWGPGGGNRPTRDLKASRDDGFLKDSLNLIFVTFFCSYMI